MTSMTSMTKCKKCNVYVVDERCPLCYRTQERSATKPSQYPDYNLVGLEEKKHIRNRILLFIGIVVAVVCLTVNALTFRNVQSLWSFVVIAVMLFVRWAYFAFVSKKLTTSGRILLLYALVVVVLLAIDDGSVMWSTTYVLPFLTIVVTLMITVLAVREKRSYHKVLGYLIAALALCVCPIVLFLLSLSTVVWPSVVSLVYSLLTVVGMYIFSDNDFKNGLKKQMHS